MGEKGRKRKTKEKRGRRDNFKKTERKGIAGFKESLVKQEDWVQEERRKRGNFRRESDERKREEEIKRNGGENGNKERGEKSRRKVI